MAAITRIAVSVLDKFDGLLHEKIDWMFDRHIICYSNLTDPTQFREYVYRSDVQSVVLDYTVQLQAVLAIILEGSKACWLRITCACSYNAA